MLTTTTVAEILIIQWPDGLEAGWLGQDGKFASMIRHKTDYYGDGEYHIPITDSINGSHTFADAINNTNSPSTHRFLTPFRETHVVARIDGALIARARDDGSVVDAVTLTTKSALHSFGRTIAHDVWGNGGGSRGRFTSTVTLGGTTFVLNDPDDIRFLMDNMVIKLASTDGTSGSVRAGSLSITAINEDSTTAQVTVDQNINAGVPAAAASDYIFRDGDFSLGIQGVQAWNPRTDTGLSTAFNGVTRSNRVAALAGSRFSGSGNDLQSTLIRAAMRLRRNGGNPTHCFLHTMRFASLAESVNAQVFVPVDVGKPSIMFEGFALRTPGGTVMMIEEPDMPEDLGQFVKLDDWELVSAGGAPKLADEDGLTMVRSPTTRAYELRYQMDGNVRCMNPINQCSVQLDS